MASNTIKTEKSQNYRSSPRLQIASLLLRRCVAGVVEVSLAIASGLVPYGVGLYVQSGSPSELVPLNPVLATVEEAIAKTLALPRRPENQQQVPPLTNLFWWGALISPAAIVTWQLYLLGKTGQTTPKNWLNVRVVTIQGTSPGLIRAGFREIVGRWGLPVGTAYLIWRYAGVFPNLGILLGLSGIFVVAETATLLFSSQLRSLHDRLAGTLVIDAFGKVPGFAKQRKSNFHHSRPITVVEVQTNQTNSDTDSEEENFDEEAETASPPQEKVTTIVLTTTATETSKLHLWRWMRQHPGTTLLIVALSAMASVLGTFVGTQIYIQTQANQREFNQQKDKLFLALVRQLSSTPSYETDKRQGAILALARLEDSRAAPLLVDLLAQEDNPFLIETIQQALVSIGKSALPSLQRLNQSLDKDLEVLQQQGTEAEQETTALRLVATQRAIAKLLALDNQVSTEANLSNTHLGALTLGEAKFSLILDKTDLSGINFRGANLTYASFQESRFYGTGEDKRWGTFDDELTDFSGADLTRANLAGADLRNVLLNRSSLLRANLRRANLSSARAIATNFSSASLLGANFRQAILENASFTGADLEETNFSYADLQQARFGQVSAVDSQFDYANLTATNWQGANLTAANFNHAHLKQADFSFATLKGANLSNAQLENTSLRYANLSATDLRGANLAGANFQGVRFFARRETNSEQFLQPAPIADSVAKIEGVNFAQVKNLDAQQIDFICRQGGIHPQCF
ncbi:MAG: pentapeptide repeat-containing protein [Oscillatoria sp. PMC 1051.18]|nr:pentapeptide repeat-containing protein [Oscillatoria sp. PMC 1050.18]MEC5032565.1 pentapeptide repeat-containing protein [Oscillatoria sp. PMC 1051.18]